MKVCTELPYEVEVVEHALIEMPDGCRLSATLRLPVGAGPAPAIVEYVPYAKRHMLAARDAIMHGWFAGQGFASVRVDLRGSGESEGVLVDEYLEQELADGERVIAWVAAQPWCTGAVGLIGKSWGGFNALQLAARRPAALGAIVTVCSTDDRYADDVHYMGGCLLGDNLSWASVMLGLNALPPDRALVGEAWREMWFARLGGSGLWVSTWLRHQRRDAYWRHGSVCEDYGAIECPVLAVGGWADGYSNAVFRLIEHLDGPRMGLVGPWSHHYPHQGTPGPAIGFLQGCRRFFDRWLRGGEGEGEAEPTLRVFLQHSAPPRTRYAERAGVWVAEAWPSPRVEPRRWVLAPGHRLVPGGAGGRTRDYPVRSPLSVGAHAGKWWSYGVAPDLPGDQREDDGGSLVFEGEPAKAPLQLLGAPVAELVLRSDRPVAQVVVRLSDVAPDRRATRISYGVLNLTHRDSHAEPEPLVVGRWYRVRVPLNALGQVVAAGHRLRVSISTCYWPLVWPSPRPAQLTVRAGESVLWLPVRTPPRVEAPVVFEPAEGAAPPVITTVEAGAHRWQLVRDLGAERSSLLVTDDAGVERFEAIGLDVGGWCSERYTFGGGGEVEAEVRGRRALRRGGSGVEVTTRTVMTSDADRFRVEATVEAVEDGRRVHRQDWSETIERDLV